MNEWSSSSGLSSDAIISKEKPVDLYYFGNCINTVPKIWDATQMSYVLLTSKVLNTREVLNSIKDGDKPLPKKLLLWLQRNPDKLDDKSEIVCGVNEHQRIAFIYITDLDIHYFFDFNTVR